MLNIQDFGYIEIRFRKCIIETSVKGIFFYHVEIWSFRRLRKTSEKIAKLIELSDQIRSFINVNFHIEGKRNLKVVFDPSETIYATSFNVSDYG
jgi:hypothetical protein